jgi:hypothetical protein
LQLYSTPPFPQLLLPCMPGTPPFAPATHSLHLTTPPVHLPPITAAAVDLNWIFRHPFSKSFLCSSSNRCSMDLLVPAGVHEKTLWFVNSNDNTVLAGLRHASMLLFLFPVMLIVFSCFLGGRILRVFKW